MELEKLRLSTIPIRWQTERLHAQLHRSGIPTHPIDSSSFAAFSLQKSITVARMLAAVSHQRCEGGMHPE